MFASLDERPSLKANLKRLFLPISVALLMNIPLEVDLHIIRLLNDMTMTCNISGCYIFLPQ